ncbi:MAG: DUF1552 domain-containing protein [Myxococcales bacterium]|nr:DUF1552 domain-containing protein [Myxococcales bacterium]
MHKFLNRRTFLRGMIGGSLAAVALPPLEAMMNSNGTAFADGTDLPVRFITWFFGNGVLPDKWEPTIIGPGWELTEQLMPLAAHKDYISVIAGLRNHSEKKITHHEGMTAYNGYTMVEQQGLFSKAGGPTIDQLIADALAGQTPIKSIQLGVSKRLSIMDSGTTMHSISHRGPNEPLHPEFNPQVVWQSLFGEFQPKPDDKALRLSILDAVRDDTKRLQLRLGKKDNERLDAHLQGVSELETKINAIMPVCELPSMPAETNDDINGQEPLTAVNQAMADLLAYAFICDITRVASCLFVGGAAETTFAEINDFNGHHNNTHDPSPQGLMRINAGVIYIMERLAEWLSRFKASEDDMGLNLLDSSIIYVGSDCSTGWDHSITRQPILVCGHGRNQLKYPGEYLQVTPPPGDAMNISDLLLTFAQRFDPAIASVGGDSCVSTTPYTPILA